MSSTIKTSNTDIQRIETFDLGLYKNIEYSIHCSSDNHKSISKLDINHDGVNLSFTQEGYSNPILELPEYTVSLNEFRGNIYVEPKFNNTIYTIDFKAISANLYGEHLRSGEIISSETGFGLDLESSPQNITIRSDDINEYVSANSYLMNNKLGPVSLNNNLLTKNWISNNYSELTVLENKAIAKSSGQNNNYQFQKINTIPGKVYKISATYMNINRQEDRVKENSNFSRGDTFIKIIDSNSTLLNIQASDESREIEEFFIAQSEETLFTFGYGSRGSSISIENYELCEVVPFHTFEQKSGFFYIEWNRTSSNIISIGDLNIIDDETNVKINNDIVGQSEIKNKLLLSIFDNTYKLNNITGIIDSVKIDGLKFISVGSLNRLSYSPDNRNITSI